MFTTTVWAGSQLNRSTGTGFGINIPIEQRDAIFKKHWKEIELFLDKESYIVPITGAFWDSCSEVRSPVIGMWLVKHGADTWPKYHPTKLVMSCLGGNKFKVEING